MRCFDWYQTQVSSNMPSGQSNYGRRVPRVLYLCLFYSRKSCLRQRNWISCRGTIGNPCRKNLPTIPKCSQRGDSDKDVQDFCGMEMATTHLPETNRRRRWLTQSVESKGTPDFMVAQLVTFSDICFRSCASHASHYPRLSLNVLHS